MESTVNFEPPNSHYLHAAEGWLELGSPAEASQELAHIAPALQGRPEVLAVRWQIHARERQWEKCVTVARQLVEQAPELPWGWVHRSFALHELGRTREAFDLLMAGATQFPRDWLMQYNLACYCCQLGETARAQQFLEQACKLGDAKQIKEMAAEDTDLRKLWEAK